MTGPIALSQVTVPASSVSGGVSGFPLRINLADLLPETWAALSAEGIGALRAHDVAGAEIPLDVVWSDAGTESGEAFVKVDLSPAVSTVITLGVVVGATAAADTDPTGRNAVWSFAAGGTFIHGAAPLVNRAGSGAVALTGSVPTADPVGDTPRWMHFNGASGNYLTADLDLATTWTVGATVRQTSVTSNRGFASVMLKDGGSTTRATLLSSSSRGCAGVWKSGDTYLLDTGAPNSTATTERRRFHMVHVGSSSRSIWRNGVLANSGSISGARPTGAPAVLNVGSGERTVEPMQGYLQYVYMAPSILPAAWLAAEQASWEGSSFYVVAAPAAVVAALSGTGAFSAVATPVTAVLAALTGSGAFSATVTAGEPATPVHLTGSGAYSATAGPGATMDPPEAYGLHVEAEGPGWVRIAFATSPGAPGAGLFYASDAGDAGRRTVARGADGLWRTTFAVSDSTAYRFSTIAYSPGGARWSTSPEVLYYIAPRVGALTMTGSLTSISAEATAAHLTGSGAFSAAVSVTASVAAHLVGAGAFSATVTVSPHATNTGNRVGGRTRSGYAVATWEAPIAPAPPRAAIEQARVSAAAFSDITMQGARPTYTVSQASIPGARQRILMGGKDITYLRGVPTPEVEYELMEPLLYGPATVDLPQVSPLVEPLGVGRLRWMRPGARVVVQSVVDDVVVSTDYKGVVLAYDTSGPDLSIEVGGEAQGRAALRYRPTPIFRDTHDIGRRAWRAMSEIGVPFEPRLGPKTGIKVGAFGGMYYLDYVQDLCARAWTRSGAQWSIMPNAAGIYKMRRKDRETVDFTLYCDDSRTVANLRRDTAEEPNRIFANGVTPKGQRVRFGAYPGLKQTKAPAYPMTDGRRFGWGTANADTDTGGGIAVLVNRLGMLGYLDMDDLPGGFDLDVDAAVRALQEDADLTRDGWVTPALWRVLWDLDITGHSLRWSHIEPAASKPYTRKWRRAASGAPIGRNPRYNPHRLIVDRNVDMGAGGTRGQMREWSRAELESEDNWVGSITINMGAVLAGNVTPGATVTPSMLRRATWIKPGMNARLPLFAGGITVHVSGVSVRDGIVTLAVDTRARDAMEVWQIVARNAEARADTARRRLSNRASTRTPDAIDVWDEVGGTIDGAVKLVKGWNVVPVVAGQEGTVSRLRLQLADKGEFACAVFGRSISPARLNGLVELPLTTDGTDAWERRKVRRQLDARGLLYSAGTDAEPCGYSPGRKSKTNDPTGLHADDAGFAYRTGPQPVVYLAVWVKDPTSLKGGRVMWPQLESGV